MGREDDNLPPSRTRPVVMELCIYAPIRLHCTVMKLIKHMDNFTDTFPTYRQ
jgi:hypothetical protein